MRSARPPGERFESVDHLNHLETVAGAAPNEGLPGIMGDVSLASKLQLKPTQRVAILRLPADVDLDLGDQEIHDDPSTADAVLLFVRTKAELGRHADAMVEAVSREALVWVAYPKAGQLGTDLNRDSLAVHLLGRGVRAVRQVAVDDVWSALRFRPAESRE